MGLPMAMNLIRAGHELTVHNRTPEKARPLLAAGAVWASTSAEAARGAEVVCTMLGLPAYVEEVYFGQLLPSHTESRRYIDFTTSSPELARRIAQELPALDSPVTGGDTGAKAGTLSALVGGDAALLDTLRPLYAPIARNVTYFGPPGSGQHAKAANQIAIAGALQGTAEAIAYAQSAGLDPSVLLKAIAHGAAGSWQLEHMGAKMIRRDWRPGFKTRHLQKDLRLALDAARERNLPLPSAELTLHRLSCLPSADEGTQALIKEFATLC